MGLFSLFDQKPKPEKPKETTPPVQYPEPTEEEILAFQKRHGYGKRTRAEEIEHQREIRRQWMAEATPCPQQTRYLYWFTADAQQTRLKCHDVEYPFEMTIDTFPLPARANDRYTNDIDKPDIVQGFEYMLPFTTVKRTIDEMGCKLLSRSMGNLSEMWDYKAPDETEITVQDYGNNRTSIILSVNDNRTNRILFDCFDNLTENITIPFTAMYYFDYNLNTKKYLDQPFVIVQKNLWNRMSDSSYPQYIDIITAKKLYLYDDNNPAFSYDKLWRFCAPEKLDYWAPVDEKMNANWWFWHEFNPNRPYAESEQNPAMYKSFLQYLTKATEVNCSPDDPTIQKVAHNHQRYGPFNTKVPAPVDEVALRAKMLAEQDELPF